MLLDKDSDTLSIAASLGLSDEIVDGTLVRVGEGVSGRVAKSREALVLIDSDDAAPAAADRRAKIASAITAPIIDKDAVIGVINLNRTGAAEPFSKENLSVVTSFAGQFAVAIENARLYGDLEATFLGTIGALAAAVDAQGPVHLRAFERGHRERGGDRGAPRHVRTRGAPDQARGLAARHRQDRHRHGDPEQAGPPQRR